MEHNRLVNCFDLEHGQAFLESLPQTVFVELTRRCNMYCTCCRPQILSSPELDMPDDVLERIEAEVLPTARVIDFRGWGESSIDDRLPDLIGRWSNKGKQLFLYTNCQTKDQSYWEEMFRQNIHVLISLRSGRKELYESFMRGASHQRLLSHLKKIPEENQVYFTVVLGDDNLYELQDIANLAIRYHVRQIHLNPLSNRPNPSDYPQLGVREENYMVLADQLSKLNELCKNNDIQVNVCADLFSRNRHMLKRCIHPWSYVYIAYDGSIGFCDHLMCVENSVMGNITSGFTTVWNNEKYQKLRQRHATKNIRDLFCSHFECLWCYENRYGNWEHLVLPENKAYSLADYLDLRPWE